MVSKNKPSEAEIEEKRRLRAEKKKKEAEKKEVEGEAEPCGSSKPLFTLRNWVEVERREEGRSNENANDRVRVLSWNILAQGLVRRKLFPGSDCLKWKEREPGLCAEMKSHDWDVAAFQEVDKIEVHGPNMEQSGRRYLYSKGYPSKQHGLMIAWRVECERNKAGPSSRVIFQHEPVGSKIIYFDREFVSSKADGRRGLSRVTRNIALFAALARSDDNARGILVATTHLFWHPMHAYERVRQTGILKRSLVEWRDEHPAWLDWPIILAGDFNDQPHSATYKLMTGEPLTMHNWEEVQSSAVVHTSVDEAQEKERNIGEAAESGEVDEGEQEEEEGDEKEAGEDDRIIKNCRRATPEDGLLSLGELIQLHDLSQPKPGRSTVDTEEEASTFIGHKAKAGLVSAYGSNYGSLREDQEGNYFGSSNRGRERFDDDNWTSSSPNPHLGPCKEPMFTLHSTIFALTLDYIFLFPSQPTVTALLPTHRTEVLAPGVPRKGICASDHVAIGAELSLSTIDSTIES